MPHKPRKPAKIGTALRRAGGSLLATARRSMDAGGDARAIHDLRKTLKRWHAFLRLVEAAAGDLRRPLNIAARGLARQLGPARDCQAALDALGDLKAKSLDASVRAAVTGRLTALRDAVQRTAPVSRRTAGRVLREARKSLDAIPFDALDIDAVAAALYRSYRRAQRAVPAEWSKATPQELHELRKRVVVHLSQMELLRRRLSRDGKTFIRDAQRLRSLLGHYRDLTLLEDMTAGGGALAQWREDLAPAIASRRKQRLVAAERCAANVFAAKPKAAAKAIRTTLRGSR